MIEIQLERLTDRSEITFWEITQEDTQKEKLVTLTERDTLILEAALEFGADYFYHIKNFLNY